MNNQRPLALKNLARLLGLAVILAFTKAVPNPVLAVTNTAFTAKGSIVGVPFMGNMLPKGDGTVQVRNLLMILKTECADPLIAGRKTGTLNGDFPSGFNYGSVVHELGAWSLDASNNPAFTPSGPYWEGQWKGTSQANGSVSYESFCRGHGGAIEGLVYSETEVRGATTNILDPAVYIEYRGTYGREDALGLIIADDFSKSDPRMQFRVNSPSATCSIKEGQAVIDAQFKEATGAQNTGAWSSYSTELTLQEDKMVAVRADLIYAEGSNLMFHLGYNTGAGTYLAFVGQNYVGLDKYSSGHSFFFLERPKVALTNVVLSLALHRKGENVFVTTKIQDKGPGQAVLYQKTVVDTPASDPCLSGPVELEDGVFMTSIADPPGRPWTYFSLSYFGLWQNTNGKQPPAKAVFDNFTVTKHSLPALRVQPAIAITWPSTAFPFELESSTSIESNTIWRPVLEPQLDWNGMKQVTIPLPSAELTEFFRLK